MSDEYDIEIEDMDDVHAELHSIEHSLDAIATYLSFSGHTMAESWVTTIADSVFELRRTLRRHGE
jgi:hypothetical protein